ncbi:MAG: OmpH family outer membrane protein [Alistipes sp.]|nr:OmpH family outer membrane protein [Alistipes sp.]
MKRLVLILALMLSFTAASAQNYAVVNSEKIFKSIAAYNEAITQLDQLAEKYQKEVDAKFEQIETLYNNYMQRRASLSEASQKANEDNILRLEQEATEYQESLFGTDGELMKKRLELIQPIQKRVFAAIEEYAKAKELDMIIDTAQNATMLYHSAKADHTEAIIAILNTK